ncbi:hypothetical protein FA13DRAFT_1708098 [Coprinellus micaceus]|uniref:Uncharacterized protein n=1 Tax=Coprinellus micaceus TaxID=71717 RepID=A0A4Y7TIW2_COPMI|nr:hypothetical protein FA13DRAFT_1708098 [Coprinellus micaceus]
MLEWAPQCTLVRLNVSLCVHNRRDRNPGQAVFSWGDDADLFSEARARLLREELSNFLELTRALRSGAAEQREWWTGEKARPTCVTHNEFRSAPIQRAASLARHAANESEQKTAALNNFRVLFQ